ncbi:MAG: MgtC/SapB family protein [Oscillospiraceae bacterium]
MKFFEYITELNSLSIIIRLILAVVCGGVIGIDRGKRRQAAGFRTHILVAMGSALVMITNIYIVGQYSAGQDPTRIAAQVVSGIGFLGVGTIIVTGNKQIKGLTTAAGLWASACMGLSIGAGHYLPAIVSCILILVVMSVLNNVDKWVYQRSKIIELYIEFEDIKFVTKFLSFIRKHKMRSSNLEITKSKVLGKSEISLLVTVTLPKRQEHIMILERFSKLEGLNFIEEL